jgi:hypothetical protein
MLSGMNDRQVPSDTTKRESQDVRTPSGTDTQRDRPPDSLPTFSVAEIAGMLGISTDAVRARIHRGTLDAVKVEGVWNVRLPDDAPVSDVPPDPSGAAPNATASQSGANQDPTANMPDSRQDALVDHLQSEVTYLRERLEEAERERERILQQMANERERFDVIHRTALGRIEALTATTEDRQGSLDPSGTRPDAPGSTESDENPPKGTWHGGIASGANKRPIQ